MHMQCWIERRGDGDKLDITNFNFSTWRAVLSHIHQLPLVLTLFTMHVCASVHVADKGEEIWMEIAGKSNFLQWVLDRDMSTNTLKLTTVAAGGKVVVDEKNYKKFCERLCEACPMCVRTRPSRSFGVCGRIRIRRAHPSIHPSIGHIDSGYAYDAN